MRIIELSRSALPGGLGPTSKLNRDPAFIAGLIAHGEARAGEFLTALAFESAWAAGDVDATVALPLRRRAPRVARRRSPSTAAVRGREAVERFLRDHLVGATAIDVTRKQVAGERVTWSARWHPRDAPAPVRGAIEVEFDGDRVASLRLIAP